METAMVLMGRVANAAKGLRAKVVVMGVWKMVEVERAVAGLARALTGAAMATMA